MPPTARPWSTQYSDDYNRRSAGQARRKTQKQGRIWYRTPKATPVVMPTYPPQPPVDNYYVDLSDDEGVEKSDENQIQLPVTEPEPEVETEKLPEKEPEIPEAVDIPKEAPKPQLHWLCWPEPKTRPKTSQGFHRETEKQQTFNFGFGNVNPLDLGNPAIYEPELEKWLNGNRVTDKNSADENMMQRSQTFYEPTNRRMTSISVNDPPMRDSYTLYSNIRRPNSVDPAGYYKQAFFPYHQPGGAGVREDMVVQGMAKEMCGKEPAPYNRTFSFNKYPLHMRKTRSRQVSQDYVHEHSMFMTTTPRCVGHFIIHPDWVSERGGIRRSHSMIQPNRTNKVGLRY